MSSPFATAATPIAVPPTKEFTAAWIAYLSYALSTFLFWPAIVGLIINYSKRGHAGTGFIDSHHRWMIRSFWYSQLAFLFFFLLLLAGLWPTVSDIARQVAATGQIDPESFSINIDWSAIFTTVGGAMAGGLGIALTWFWYIYRLARGMFGLADARPMP
jgi:uncharacterized membrane protein